MLNPGMLKATSPKKKKRRKKQNENEETLHRKHRRRRGFGVHRRPVPHRKRMETEKEDVTHADLGHGRTSFRWHV